MDIFELLRMEHTAAASILDDIIDLTEPDSNGHAQDMATVNRLEDEPHETRLELLSELKIALLAHDRAEEAVLYEALGTLAQHQELADLKAEEHHLIEEILVDLEHTDPSARSWEKRLRLLKSQLDCHIAEEETNVFSILQPLIDAEMSAKMATEFELLRDEITTQLEFYADRTSLFDEPLKTL